MKGKTVLSICCIVLGLTIICAVPSQSAPNYAIPSYPGVVHLDTGPFVLQPWQLYYQGFRDDLMGYDWYWESEVSNPNPYTIRDTWGWYYRGTLLGAYDITLQPGSSFYVGWRITETPETGRWGFWAWNPTATAWGLHCTVVEDAPPDPWDPWDPPYWRVWPTPDVSWSYVEEGTTPNIKLELEVVPEPGSLLALGGGLIGLAGMVIRRRR